MRFHFAVWLAFSVMTGLTAWGAEAGKPAPSFEARLLNGEDFSTAKAGDVILIHYWATWCAPCRKEMPEIEAYYRRHRGDGLRVVAISMDDPEDIDKVRDVMRAYSFAAAMAADVRAKGYGRIWRIPLTFVVDRKGILRKDGWAGESGLDEASMEQDITPLLQAK